MANVLVADDDAALREILRFNLELEGHMVAVAEDGAEALDELRRMRPDVLVLDMMMRGTSGADVLEALTSSLVDQPWPCVIAFSASESHLDVAWGLGAHRTVLKDGNLDALLAAVASCAGEGSSS